MMGMSDDHGDDLEAWAGRSVGGQAQGRIAGDRDEAGGCQTEDEAKHWSLLDS